MLFREDVMETDYLRGLLILLVMYGVLAIGTTLTFMI